MLYSATISSMSKASSNRCSPWAGELPSLSASGMDSSEPRRRVGDDCRRHAAYQRAVASTCAAEVAADLPADLVGQGFTAQKLDRQSPRPDLPISASAAGDRQIALDPAQRRPDVRHGSAEGG